MITLLIRPTTALILALTLLVTAQSRADGGLQIPDRRPIAPELVLTDIHGVTHRLSDLRGSVVLVNFWATWCPPCRLEMPALQRLFETLKGPDFHILAVATGEDLPSIAHFYRSLPEPLTFTLLPDPQNTGWRAWPFHGLPATFIIDKSGHIVHLAEGFRDWDSPGMVAALRALMAEPFDSNQPELRAEMRTLPRIQF